MDAGLAEALEKCTCFVSINRFERKKDVGLALRAFGFNPTPSSWE